MNNVNKLLNTINYAAEMHQNQRRKVNDIPYINHPVAVANLLTDCGCDDVEIIQAALLHDVVEYTDGTYEDILKRFGERIAHYVQEVSDDKSLTAGTRKRLQVEHVRDCSFEACFIKLADKWHNLSSLLEFPPPKWSHERICGYFLWSTKIIEIMSIRLDFVESEKYYCIYTKLYEKLQLVFTEARKMNYFPEDYDLENYYDMMDNQK